jgi:hypothetical protein
MVRAVNLFAAASVALLIVGLVLSNFFEKTQQMSVRWPGSHTGYGIGCQVPCYGLAGLFAFLACFYALGWIRLSEAMVDWHLWLSLTGVAMFGFGFALLARVAAEGAAPQPGQRTLLVIAAGMYIGPAMFVAGQLLLMIALLVRFAAPHH